MSDQHRKRPSRSRAQPARPGAPAGDSRRGKGPTPARALLEDAEAREDTPTPARAVEETILEADGERWRAQVCGRARTGAATGAAPLLLVAFRRDGAEATERESLVVGRSLAGIGEEALLAALHRGRPPAEPGSRTEIFPEVGGRKRDR